MILLDRDRRPLVEPDLENVLLTFFQVLVDVVSVRLGESDPRSRSSDSEKSVVKGERSLMLWMREAIDDLAATSGGEMDPSMDGGSERGADDGEACA
jgi:hypothetical protein